MKTLLTIALAFALGFVASVTAAHTIPHHFTWFLSGVALIAMWATAAILIHTRGNR